MNRLNIMERNDEKLVLSGFKAFGRKKYTEKSNLQVAPPSINNTVNDALSIAKILNISKQKRIVPVDLDHNKRQALHLENLNLNLKSLVKDAVNNAKNMLRGINSELREAAKDIRELFAINKEQNRTLTTWEENSDEFFRKFLEKIDKEIDACCA